LGRREKKEDDAKGPPCGELTDSLNALDERAALAVAFLLGVLVTRRR
jgi:hypothetical protein